MTQTVMDVEEYQREGYIIVPGAVPAEELSRAQAEAERLMEVCGREPERFLDRVQWEADYVEQERETSMARVVRMIEPVCDISPVFDALSRYAGVVDPVSEIFGDDVALFEDKLNLKLPGGSRYAWHQDWVCCWRAHTDSLITCFVHLDDASLENGALQVIPRTHIGKPQLPFKEGSRFEIDPDHVPAERAVPVVLHAGDMLVFDPYLLHYSDVNRSVSPRRTVIYTYNPARLGRINEGRLPAETAGPDCRPAGVARRVLH